MSTFRRAVSPGSLIYILTGVQSRLEFSRNMPTIMFNLGNSTIVLVN